jgi:tyrosine-specific transport protein
MKSKFFPALAVLVGTAIGAGFLGAPYVISKSGFLPGLAWLLFVAVFMLFVKLYLGEVILRTHGNHQLAGYAGRYLGKTGKMLMFFAMLFGIYSALIAYLIGEGQSLSYVLLGSTNLSFYFSLFFWLLMSFLTFIGLRALKKYEKIAMFIVLGFVFLIAIFYFKDVRVENLNYVNSDNLFIPFGVVLFSMLAFSAIPEVERILAGQEKLMKKVIFFGVLIPFVVYLIFMIIVVGKFGSSVPEIATLAFPRFFSLLAVLTMFTAFFAQSIAIRDMFRFDFKLGRFKGWLISCFLPLILFLLIYFFKLVSFVQLLSVAGVVSGGVIGILVLLMNKQAKKTGHRKPEYSIPLSWLAILIISIIFALAVVAEFVF